MLSVPVWAAGVEAGAPLSSVGCGDIQRFLERSQGAFPPFLDRKMLLEYPVREALNELGEVCRERELSGADVREAIETHVRRSLAPGQSRFTLAIVSFAWCSSCARAFPDYARLVKKEGDVVRFVFLDGDAYDGSVERVPESPFANFVSGLCGVRLLPFYPGYCVLDDRGRAPSVDGEPSTQSLYGSDGLRIAMKRLRKMQKRED